MNQKFLSWNEDGREQKMLWVCESRLSPPQSILFADDRLTALKFEQAASQGAGFIWRGDFQNAKQLLQAVQRRLAKKKKAAAGDEMSQLFHRHRQFQSHRAQLLSRLLIKVEKDFTIRLRRAPDTSLALRDALPDPGEEFLISLRELLGFIGAHEWRKKGVYIAELNDRIFPKYGVFSPARGEYLELVEQAKLPANAKFAVDVGTGTGVIAALLVKKGISRVLATDLDPRARDCACENIARLQMTRQIEVVDADLFPASLGTVDLAVCNPPWLPAKITSPIEASIYDPDSRMLRGFLTRVGAHLATTGEAWLILSDLGEHLGLRSRAELMRWMNEGGLQVVERLTAKPRHQKVDDSSDLLHRARREEETSLWRLRLK